MGRKLLVVSLFSFLVLSSGGFADEEGEAFRFSVMGDNRPPGDREDVVTQPEEFHQAIREANLLNPDLVLVLGDLIMGYDDDADQVAKQWAAYDEAKKAFRMLVVDVAGNHDVWDEPSSELFLKRNGWLYSAFTHKGCRFIVLNSEDVTHPEKIAGEQLSWLKGVLAEEGARRTFVFLHKPFWRYQQGGTNWMEEVHPLLVKASVDAVFAGHWHNYERSTDRDGIRYYITGGAGAEIGENAWAGDFFHHLVVDVPADDEAAVEVHVLKTGFLEKDTVVTEVEREKSWALTKALVPSGIRAKEGEDADAIVRVAVKNPWNEPLVVTWTIDPEESGGWSMEPAPTTTLLAPNGEGLVAMRFTAAADFLLPGPMIAITGTKGGETVVKSTQRVPVRFDRVFSIAAATGPIEIDGEIAEEAWGAATPAGKFLMTDGADYTVYDTDFRMVRDAENLYISWRCAQPGADELTPKITNRDWRMLSEDCVLLYLDPVRDGKSRYCFGVTAGGVCMDYRSPGGAPDLEWSPDWPLAVNRTAEGYTVEMALPFALLEMDPIAGFTLGLNIVRYVTGEEGEMSAWSIPAQGSLSNPAGFGSAVLK